jgi:nucleoside phosphorylase
MTSTGFFARDSPSTFSYPFVAAATSTWWDGCALPVELAMVQDILNEEHDTSIYTCGRVGEHNIVIARLPEGQTGTHSAAAVAVQMKLSFSSIRFGLMVGIGGGVPNKEVDIGLGDVVVSKPHKVHGGVVQYLRL